MNRVVLSALWAHWRRAPLQLFTMLAGLALATALWSGVQAVNAEARASYDAAAATLGEGRFDQLLPADGRPIRQGTYVALRRAGWLVSPVIEGRLNGVRVVGLEPLTAPGGLGPVELSGNGDVVAFLSGQGQVFGTQAALAALGDVAAEKVAAPQVAPQTVLTDIGIAQDLLDRAGQIDRLMVAPEQPLRQVPLAEAAPGLMRQAAAGGSDVARLTDSFHLNLTAFGLLSFAVGLFIVNGAIGLAFEQRRALVRTLRALGVPLRRLVVLMAAEMLALAVIAGLIGLGLGYLLAAALLPDVAATLRGLYGAEVSGTLRFRPVWWASGMAIAVIGAAVAAAAAFWQIARMPLLAGGQKRALAMASGRRARFLGLAGGLLLVVAVAFAIWGQGLIGGFGLLGGLLLGGALLLPLVLDRVLALAARRAQAVRPAWFWADTRQQLPGLSLALMALLLAMAANIGVSTMVSSFRMTFVGFLDQRLASELYVTIADPADVPAFRAFAATRSDAVLPVQSVPGRIADQPTEVFGAVDHATYRDNWRFLSGSADAWDAVAAGDAILINEQLARRAGLAVGDAVPLGGQVLVIAGVYGDYGNPTGQAVIGDALFASLYPQVVPTRFGLRLDPAAVPDLRAALEAELGIPQAQMINQAGIKSFSMDVFERTFTVTTALNVLTLAVAGFAMLMSLLTLASMRVPQLAPAWAMGLTRRDLGWLELLRAVILAALTGLLALPLGLALAWALLAVVNVAAFGWKLPLFLFPLDYARLGLLALLAAALAALWPALRLSRTPPADLLKVFSNER